MLRGSRGGHCRIDALQDVSHGALPDERLARGFRDDGHHRPGGLTVRAIHLSARGAVQREVPHTLNDADDREPGIVALEAAELQALPDRILAAPEQLRRRPADDDDLLAVADVVLVEIPPAEERNAERVKVAGARHAEVGAAGLTGLGRRASFDHESAPRVRAAQRQMVDRTDRSNARQRRDAFSDASTEAGTHRRTERVGLREGHLHRQHVRRVHAGLHLEQSAQASQHQSGAAQDNDGEPQFRGDKHAPYAGGEASRSAFAFAKQRLWIGASQADERPEPEQRRGYSGRHGREEQHARVDHDRHAAAEWQRAKPRRQREIDRSSGEPRESDAGDGPGAGQHEALGQHLLRKPPCPGAERQAEDELAASGEPEPELQVGDVHTRDQKHEPDGARQHHEDLPHVQQPVVGHPRDDRAFLTIVLVALRQRAPDSSDVGLRLLEGDIRLQASRDVEGMRAALPILAREANRHPDAVRPVPGTRSLAASRRRLRGRRR